MEIIARLFLSSSENSVVGRILFCIFIWLLLVFMAGLMWQTPVELFFSYCLLSLYLLHRFRSKSSLIYFAIGFVLGPLGEIVTVSLGAWSYTNTSFIFPVWLPLAWGIAAICLKQLGDAIEELGAVRK